MDVASTALPRPMPRLQRPQPTQASGLASSQGSQGMDSVFWSKALALPAYTYEGAASSLSGLTAFAKAFPPGGVVITPSGVHTSPRWAAHFAPGSLGATAQPLIAGVGAALAFVRAGTELAACNKTGDSGMAYAAALDLSTGLACAAQLVAPAAGAAVALALTTARGLLELHQQHAAPQPAS